MSEVVEDVMHDVVIVGGGAAGLSAALTLARARRSVVVIDAGEPRNAPAQAAHGLLGLEGINPRELLARGRGEASAYGAQTIAARVVDALPIAGGVEVTLDDRAVLRARQLLLATGVVDDLPDISGLRERWGRDVVHCPYCHGWEIRDHRIGLLATGPMSVMQALLFHQWSDDVTFFPNGLEFRAEELAKLTAVGIPILEGPVTGIEVSQDRLCGVWVGDVDLVELQALAVPSLARVRLEGLGGLGVETVSHAGGTVIAADAAGHTNTHGVWAAGNAVNPSMQVGEAAANGARVAMTINTELVLADAEQALSGVRTAVEV